ncbi:hypothetical protein [Reyranella sp.]|jgi:hypothetical protein|uniref:hypothetical protein n=1 Tax=Reyranella sp. TaxID=1929291 RepID=UPI000BCEB01A|nr:hypothetical protein [Reyranella sp.]OYY34450.1 MAG: hypothetical protein B7Y57_28090 [Rhodospirillales bacterium 35-66-84]OYZ91018.1 MAG: hypothetical protein B7Y08_27995 [Rhodospirillales bacterium 24-66-33]OZB21514.1 MAG: hypothetical protein B7X63_27090 [Rhodospirillales bacterium 39-66-50]HQS18591.1 hypothetical protein [Reyranella sp.]HQT15412.1 hypothetical protein [Reyranella sp.]
MGGVHDASQSTLAIIEMRESQNALWLCCVTVGQGGDRSRDQRDRDQRGEAADHGHAPANRALAWRTPFTVSGVSRLPL